MIVVNLEIQEVNNVSMLLLDKYEWFWWADVDSAYYDLSEVQFMVDLKKFVLDLGAGMTCSRRDCLFLRFL